MENVSNSLKPNTTKDMASSWGHRLYLDDIFLLFDDSSQINKFEKYMNSRHKNRKFTKEIEKDNSLAFLDILIGRKRNKFETSIYRKFTFSGVC